MMPTFTYPDGEEPDNKNVSFKAKKETIAFIKLPKW